MRILKRKPSPALVVAIAALSIALVGTAVAGPIATSSLSKNERRITAKIARTLSLRFIKRFTAPLANRQITMRAPGLSVANAENASNAENAANADDADALDGKSINDVVMWAFVDNDGSLFRSSGGVTSTQQGTGDFDVTFPRNVDTCAYNATNAANDNVVPAPNEIAVALTNGSMDTVTVRTGSSDGTANINDEFMLQVTC